ncbi:MAG: WbqC family protein [Bacteroidales bacterium]|jgi:hypothetical protein|nr:WbqC family protein [Bacteroidales bacterium]
MEHFNINGEWRIDNRATLNDNDKAKHNCQLSIINYQFPTAYAPNTAYISAISHAEQIYIDFEEPYKRQTFRNHCEILTSQGVQKLSVPIEKKSCFDTLNNRPSMIKDVKIDYAENWQRRHWRSLQAAYNNSPFFLYYQDELRFFYEKKWCFLIEFNTKLLSFILNKMHIENRCQVIGNGCLVDLKQNTRHLSPVTRYQFPTYQQVFNNQNFIPNLSSFDLLFNCGPESKSYLPNF